MVHCFGAHFVAFLEKILLLITALVKCFSGHPLTLSVSLNPYLPDPLQPYFRDSSCLNWSSNMQLMFHMIFYKLWDIPGHFLLVSGCVLWIPGEMDNIPLTEIPFRATDGDLQVKPW